MERHDRNAAASGDRYRRHRDVLRQGAHRHRRLRTAIHAHEASSEPRLALQIMPCDNKITTMLMPEKTNGRSSMFIFRQPLLSTISNIFTLPFHRSVWMAIGVFLLLVLLLLHFSCKWESVRGTSEYWESLNPAQQTLSDNLMVVMGAVAQQGECPLRSSPRVL